MVGRVAIVFGVVLAACGSKESASPSAANPFAGATTCALTAPLEPELMAWDPAARADLDRLRRQSVVAVRYVADGCNVQLEVLPGCVGPKNKYVYTPMDSSATHIAKNVDELLAQLPVGAANVSPKLRGGGALRADYHLVGAAALPVGTTISEYDMIGADCKQATHLVSAVYLGGFGIASEGKDAAVNAFSGNVAPITREGYPAVCARAEQTSKEEPGCSAPLRVALIPINGKAPPPTCPAGWAFDGTKCTNANAVAAAPASDAGADTRPFDQVAIERVVRDRTPSVKRTCWESSPPSVRSLSVNIAVTVNPQGKVVVAEPQLVVAEGPQDVANSVARCIANDVMSWEFPPPDSTRSFQMPVHWLRQ